MKNYKDYVNQYGCVEAKDISTDEVLREFKEVMEYAMKQACGLDYLATMSGEEFEAFKKIFKCYDDLGELTSTWAANVNDIKHRQVRIESKLDDILEKLNKK